MKYFYMYKQFPQYQLSKKVPLALAVNPLSPIPWDNIIERRRSLRQIRS